VLATLDRPDRLGCLLVPSDVRQRDGEKSRSERSSVERHGALRVRSAAVVSISTANSPSRITGRRRKERAFQKCAAASPSCRLIARSNAAFADESS